MRSYVFLLSPGLLEEGVERFESFMPCSKPARSLDKGRFLLRELQGYTLKNGGLKAAFFQPKNDNCKFLCWRFRVDGFHPALAKFQTVLQGQDFWLWQRALWQNLIYGHLSVNTCICLNFLQNPHGHPDSALLCWTKQQNKKTSHQVYFQH